MTENEIAAIIVDTASAYTATSVQVCSRLFTNG